MMSGYSGNLSYASGRVFQNASVSGGGYIEYAINPGSVLDITTLEHDTAKHFNYRIMVSKDGGSFQQVSYSKQSVLSPNDPNWTWAYWQTDPLDGDLVRLYYPSEITPAFGINRAQIEKVIIYSADGRVDVKANGQLVARGNINPDGSFTAAPLTVLPEGIHNLEFYAVGTDGTVLEKTVRTVFIGTMNPSLSGSAAFALYQTGTQNTLTKTTGCFVFNAAYSAPATPLLDPMKSDLRLMSKGSFSFAAGTTIHLTGWVGGLPVDVTYKLELETNTVYLSDILSVFYSSRPPAYLLWQFYQTLSVRITGAFIPEFECVSGAFDSGGGFIPFGVPASGRLPGLGDANANGFVDANDITAIKMHLVSIKPIVGAYALWAADADESGNINAGDIALIKMHLASISALPDWND